MLRFTLYLAGVSAAIAAFAVSRNYIRSSRPVPVQKAAEQLRQAWADHHTQA